MGDRASVPCNRGNARRGLPRPSGVFTIRTALPIRPEPYIAPGHCWPERSNCIREKFEMATLVTYDAQRSHVELKKQLYARGFYSCIVMNDNSRKLLPNTTVMHSSEIGRAHV